MTSLTRARRRLAAKPLHHAPSASDGMRLLSKIEVVDLVGRSFTTLWNWMRAGKFPRALDLNGVPVWRATDIEDWIAALPQRRFKGDREPGSSGDA